MVVEALPQEPRSIHHGSKFHSGRGTAGPASAAGGTASSAAAAGVAAGGGAGTSAVGGCTDGGGAAAGAAARATPAAEALRWRAVFVEWLLRQEQRHIASKFVELQAVVTAKENVRRAGAELAAAESARRELQTQADELNARIALCEQARVASASGWAPSAVAEHLRAQGQGRPPGQLRQMATRIGYQLSAAIQDCVGSAADLRSKQQAVCKAGKAVERRKHRWPPRVCFGAVAAAGGGPTATLEQQHQEHWQQQQQQQQEQQQHDQRQGAEGSQDGPGIDWSDLDLTQEAVEKKDAALAKFRAEVALVSSSVKPAKPDMQAYKSLNKELTPKDVYGHVPGIAVGDTFNGRGEAAILGLHVRILQGIDAITTTTKGAYAICLSGGHADDKDEGAAFW
ncbi:hypothetical protein FOA52_007887 [Chlamydomonas sp. UWO 241]|nr:hypothetical protein FOA52_007887 [Chlamydomonas sp. UWO 241]